MTNSLKMGLLGTDIQRSRMPKLQQYLGQLAGLQVEYGLFDSNGIEDFDPIAAVRKLQADHYDGLNITHPYKQRICHVVDYSLAPDHAVIGSYNTLKFENGSILGANTDYSGFMRSYRFVRGDTPPGRVFLCGAGGVGRAIAQGLLKLGCSDLAIFDTNPWQSQDLAISLQSQGLNATAIEDEALNDAILAADGLINCTAIGTHSHPGTAINLSLIKNQQWALDVVYTPMNTGFLTQCRKVNMQCISGFDLWFFQGLDAFRNFTGIEIEANLALLQETLAWMK